MKGGNISEKCGRHRRARTVQIAFWLLCSKAGGARTLIAYDREWRERGTHLQSVCDERFLACDGFIFCSFEEVVGWGEQSQK